MRAQTFSQGSSNAVRTPTPSPHSAPSVSVSLASALSIACNFPWNAFVRAS